MPIKAGFPSHAQFTERGLELEFRAIAPTEFADPFCHETVSRFDSSACWREEIRRERLQDDLARDSKPAGIIFHVSRCGSTLIANALKELDGVTVYSEPPALNDILFPPHPWTRTETIAALRTTTKSLCRHAGGSAVLKLRSWNTLFAHLILEAFPLTPWVFVVRDPVEVGVSVLNKPPTWLRAFPKPDNPFLPFIDGSAATAEEYMAKMFAAFCDAIGQVVPARGIVLDYRELPQAINDVLLPHFGIVPTCREKLRIADASRAYSKCSLGTRLVFGGDSVAKQRAANYALRLAAERHACPALRTLHTTFHYEPLCATVAI